MKKSFLTWNKDSVEDEQIYNDINTLCGCTVILPEGMTLSNPKDLLQKKSKPSSNKPMNKNYQKNNNNNNNKGNNNRQYYKNNGEKMQVVTILGSNSGNKRQLITEAIRN